MRNVLPRAVTTTTAADYWKKAIDYPSATQMSHLASFFGGVAWSQLAPDHVRIRNQTTTDATKMVFARSGDGKRVVLTSGVQAGDTIVADARREVIEGSRVRPIHSQ